MLRRYTDGNCTSRGTVGMFFFFQAEDGIRDYKVTGVQTCALPISTTRRTTRREPARELGDGARALARRPPLEPAGRDAREARAPDGARGGAGGRKIGRASWRGRV